MSKSGDSVITHEQLIALAREYRQARDVSPEQQNAFRNRWECKFNEAIRQARLMGVLAVDILTDLQKLTDPDSGESICPLALQKYLANMIAHQTAVEAKSLRTGEQARQQTQRREAPSYAPAR
jgi:predicted  nucleic acid-binding Zn ribbon protein